MLCSSDINELHRMSTGMFETSVMVAVLDVLCNSLMSEEHNIYLLVQDVPNIKG